MAMANGMNLVRREQVLAAAQAIVREAGSVNLRYRMAAGQFPVVLPVYQAIGSSLFRWLETNRRCYESCLVSKERGIGEHNGGVLGYQQPEGPMPVSVEDEQHGRMVQ
jgi:hypothetical protein